MAKERTKYHYPGPLIWPHDTPVEVRTHRRAPRGLERINEPRRVSSTYLNEVVTMNQGSKQERMDHTWQMRPKKRKGLTAVGNHKVVYQYE